MKERAGTLNSTFYKYKIKKYYYCDSICTSMITHRKISFKPILSQFAYSGNSLEGVKIGNI